ncbi:MAG: hypothetical protein C0483_20190 [Pirellula sp.]|nr:hypothetical protein [Pirellula sp.]
MSTSADNTSEPFVPQDAQGFYERGDLHFRARRYDQAVADFTQTILLDPKLADARLARGIALASKHAFADALQDLDAYILLKTDSMLAYLWRGHVHSEQDRGGEALEDFNRANAIDPANTAVLRNRGLLHLDNEDYELSIADFSAAIHADPHDADAYLHRARAYASLDQNDDAVADLTAVLRLRPDCGNAYFYRGRTYREENELHLAVADLSESIRLDAFTAHAYCERGKCRYELEESEQALADLTEAIRREPDLAEAYYWRGSLLDNLGEFEKADQDFAKFEELREQAKEPMSTDKTLILPLLQSHFDAVPLDQLSITERRFPSRVRADIQRALDSLGQHMTIRQFFGVRKQYDHHGVNFTDLIVRDRNDPPCAVPPQYEEINIGEDQPVRCLKAGLWLAEDEGLRLAIFQEPFQRGGAVRFQVATVNNEQGIQSTTKFFKLLEAAVKDARSYRGKILSLEYVESYSGVETGIKVHKLRTVQREQVILPRRTLDLLDRNVIHFVKQRPRLAALGLATKKGLLFYGPPGTGKTHTLHYLAAALPNTTTLLISAEQVGILSEYMTLARLLQPSMVVIEDADLIARDRQQMSSACEEVLLNKLLNEMDGLKEDADILFVLTTNRPEAIEAALSARPGRIDQAIEFPHPDEEGRNKLVRLYAGTNGLADEVVEAVVKKTENVSAAFIKELMRRAAQFQLERESTELTLGDVEDALNELLFAGGSLNRKLLGGADSTLDSDS